MIDKTLTPESGNVWTIFATACGTLALAIATWFLDKARKKGAEDTAALQSIAEGKLNAREYIRLTREIETSLQEDLAPMQRQLQDAQDAVNIQLRRLANIDNQMEGLCESDIQMNRKLSNIEGQVNSLSNKMERLAGQLKQMDV